MTVAAPESEVSVEVTDDEESPARPWRDRLPSWLKRDPDRPPAPPLPDSTKTALWVFVVAAGLALWAITYALFFSGVQMNGSQKQLYAQLREQLASATAPVGGQIPMAQPVAVVTVPALGISDLVVVEGTTSGIMRNGPGHLPSSPLPGQAGTSVIYGKSVTYGAPFRRLTSLLPGDSITVVTGQGTFRYRVDDVRRPGDQAPAAPTADQSRLMLVGAQSHGWQSGWTASSAVFVDATYHGKIKPTPAGRPTVVPTAMLPMGVDLTALVPLVFWLQGLLLVVIGVVWVRVRWGTWRTWLVAFPLVLALLWGATNTVMALLPNLL